MSDIQKKDLFLLQYGNVDQLSDVLTRKPSHIWSAEENPALNQKHLDLVWNSPNELHHIHPNNAKRFAARRTTDPTMIAKAASHDAYSIKQAVIHNPQSANEHIEKFLSDGDPGLREDATTEANNRGILTPDHWRQLLNDPDEAVRSTAQRAYQKRNMK